MPRCLAAVHAGSKVLEVWVKERRYIVCLNEEERRKGGRRALKGATAQRCQTALTLLASDRYLEKGMALMALTRRRAGRDLL